MSHHAPAARTLARRSLNFETAAPRKNETPKFADGDRPRKSRLPSLIRDTETARHLANAPYSREFRVPFESYAKSTTCWLGRQSCTNRSPRKFPARGLFTGNFWRVRLIFEETTVLLRA